MIGTGLSKVGDIALRLDDHQVHIQRLLRVASHRFDNHRPERDIRHEMAVHDVDMNPVCACRVDGANLVGEVPEIRRQDRRCNNNRPLRRNVDHICLCAQRVRSPFDAVIHDSNGIRSASPIDRGKELRE